MKAADRANEILPLAATCLENALQSALQQAQLNNKVFSPQNWLKTVGAVQGETLVAGTIAGMLSSFPNGKLLLEAMTVPAAAFSPRWSAD